MPKCKKDQVINPRTGRCIKKGGAVWKKVFGKKSSKRKSPKKKKGCKSGYVINPETGRCIKKGGAVWKRVLGKKKPSRKAPKRKSKKRKGISSFGRELEEKLIVKAVCDDLKVTRYVKSYVARTYMLLSCLNDGIPLRASVSMWDRWIRQVKKEWSELRAIELRERARGTIIKGTTALVFKMALLYSDIQGEQKYCYIRQSSNFIAELYLKGECNCLCGTDLLFTLGKYLGYEGRITKVFTPTHAFITLPGPHGDYFEFETTKTSYGYYAETTIDALFKKWRTINGWVDNDLYGAMVSFFDYIAFKKKSKIYKLPRIAHLKYFEALYPKNSFTTYVVNAFTRPNEFGRTIRYRINNTNDLSELSVLNMVLSYLQKRHYYEMPHTKRLISTKITRLLKRLEAGLELE
jgi:hypothetical protein